MIIMNSKFTPNLLTVSVASLVSVSAVATAQIRETEASVTALAVQCAVSSGYSTASYYDYEGYARSLAKTLGMLSSGQQVKVFGYLPTPSGGGFVDANNSSAPSVLPTGEEISQDPGASSASEVVGKPTTGENFAGGSAGAKASNGGETAPSRTDENRTGNTSSTAQEAMQNSSSSSGGGFSPYLQSGNGEVSASDTTSSGAGSKAANGTNDTNDSSSKSSENDGKKAIDDYSSPEAAYRAGYSWEEIQAWLKKLEEAYKNGKI